MLNDSYGAALPLDGVTGRIELNDSRQFLRAALPGLFKQGLGLTPEEAAILDAPLPSASGVPATDTTQP